MSARRVRLQDVRDRELLAAIADLVGESGWVTSAQVAEAYGIQHARATQCAAARLAWMRRWGLLEKSTDGWRLTPGGERLRNGTIDQALEEQLKDLPEPEMVEMIGALARRRYAGSREAAIVGAREWRYWYGRDPRRIR
jgi:hypothetical protein